MNRDTIRLLFAVFGVIVAVAVLFHLSGAQTLPTVPPPPPGITELSPASVDLTNAGAPVSLSTAGANISLALPAGSIGIGTSSTTSVGNTGQGGRLVVVCGPVAGTASLLFYAGTTNTPVVLANGVGGGLIGC